MCSRGTCKVYLATKCRGGRGCVGGLSITSLLLSEIARPCSGVGCHTAFATKLQSNAIHKMQYNAIQEATQFGRVVVKTLWYTLWCEQF